jgi:hypothetical protein
VTVSAVVEEWDNAGLELEVVVVVVVVVVESWGGQSGLDSDRLCNFYGG